MPSFTVWVCRLARGRLLTREGRRWVKGEAWARLGGEQQRLIRTHFTLVDGLTRMIRRLDGRIRRVAAEVPAVRLLETIPGIGPYRGLLIATEVLPIKRFRAPKYLVSYAGLAPRSSKSGLRAVRHGPIPAGVNRWLRGALVRAVVQHAQQSGESWLTRYYQEQTQRLGWQVARIAAARRLARAVHAMLRTGEAWRSELSTGERGEFHEGHVAETT